MKNQYLTLEEYKRFLEIFELSEEERKEVNSIIITIQEIVKLKSETPQVSTNKYLKPIMLQSDYRKINKVYNIQLELKAERLLNQLKKELIVENKYTNSEIEKILEKQKEKIREDLGLRKKKNKKNKIREEDILTSIDEIEMEED